MEARRKASRVDLSDGGQVSIEARQEESEIAGVHRIRAAKSGISFIPSENSLTVSDVSQTDGILYSSLRFCG